jgi:hypothetical protein
MGEAKRRKLAGTYPVQRETQQARQMRQRTEYGWTFGQHHRQSYWITFVGKPKGYVRDMHGSLWRVRKALSVEVARQQRIRARATRRAA